MIMNALTKTLTSKKFAKLKISRQRRKVWVISCFALAISIAGFVFSFLTPSIHSPLKLGLDFTGGTQIKLDRECIEKCSPIKVSDISNSLSKISFNNENNLRSTNILESKIQLLDDSQSLIIRLPFLSASEGQEVINTVEKISGPLEKGGQSVETIGPTLGGQLLRSSLISLLVAFAGISIYIGLRYDKIYSLLAIIALAHDVIIVCGVFSWLGILLSVEINSLFAVSLLTIAGYSVNDTVVVFDRIREQNKDNSFRSLSERIDYAVSATLTRTLFTSGTTLLPLIALIAFGGSTLFWFSISLALGVVVGSWSSIALAPSLLSLKEPLQNTSLQETGKELDLDDEV